MRCVHLALAQWWISSRMWTHKRKTCNFTNLWNFSGAVSDPHFGAATVTINKYLSTAQINWSQHGPQLVNHSYKGVKPCTFPLFIYSAITLVHWEWESSWLLNNTADTDICSLRLCMYHSGPTRTEPNALAHTNSLRQLRWNTLSYTPELLHYLRRFIWPADHPRNMGHIIPQARAYRKCFDIDLSAYSSCFAIDIKQDKYRTFAYRTESSSSSTCPMDRVTFHFPSPPQINSSWSVSSQVEVRSRRQTCLAPYARGPCNRPLALKFQDSTSLPLTGT